MDGRVIGLVIKFAQILLEIDQHLAARRGRGTPNWSRDVSKTDKKHMNGKDQPKGAGKRTSFRTRAPFNREARIAQAMNEAGMCTGKCFKFVPCVPSSDPIPGHATRGLIDPVPGRLQDLYDPVPGRASGAKLLRPSTWVGKSTIFGRPSGLGDERLTTCLTQSLGDRPLKTTWYLDTSAEIRSSLTMKMTN